MRAASTVRAMLIEQALYGDSRGGHSLLVSSAHEEVSTRIIQRLDLPDTAPPGVDWSPFLRGFPHEDKYVLSRTFQDTSASRSGMVFSHALLAPLDELAETRNLEPLLRLLARSDRQRPSATTVQIVRAEVSVPTAPDLIDTADVLGSSGRLPAVRLGRLGFDDLVVALWAHLAPELRRRFAFRLSFGPHDLVETLKPALVCTPPSMAGRWSEYRVIPSTERQEPRSLAAAILTGHGKAAPLTKFMREMGVTPTSFPDLRLSEEAYRLDIGESTLEQHIGVIRLIARLSPDPNAGKAEKDVLVRRLCDVLSGARANDILLLRNIRLTAYPSPNRVWKALEQWVAENSYALDQDIETLSVVGDATTSDTTVEGWRNAVRSGVPLAARSATSGFPRAFWRWLELSPEVVAAVFHHLPPRSRCREAIGACDATQSG